MFTRSCRVGVVLLALALGACATPTVSGAPASPTPGTQSFADFVAGLRQARYQDFAATPGARVRGEKEFTEMRQYLLDRYADADVASSQAIDGAVFDCQRSASPSPVVPPAPMPSPMPTASPSPRVPTRGTRLATVVTSVAAVPACPEGTVPVRRVTLAELTRFTTLADFLGKDPGGAGGAPPVPSR